MEGAEELEFERSLSTKQSLSLKMADEIETHVTVGTVSRLREICRENRERQHLKLKVWDVFRYLEDKSCSIGGISTASDSTDVFDVVLTDGRFKTTCVLSPQFNDLVYSFRLRKNSLLLLTDYSSYVDDEDFDAQLIIILQGLEILGNQDEVKNNACGSDISLPFCIDSSAKEKNGVPLTTSRGCYLPLWNDHDFVGAAWNNPEMEQKLKLKHRIGRVISIFDLGVFSTSMRRPYPAVIGRVVGKSKIFFFGKPVDKKYKFPFVANLVIEDRSSFVTVCLWNSMCVHYYKHISVGDILYVAGYRISRKYRPTNNTVYTTKPAVNIELSLNPSNPTGEIYKLSSDDLSLEYEIPEVPYRFIDSGVLSQFPQGLICDVAGVVTYVSRAEREKKQHGNGFSMYKWLHLRDGSSDFPIIIKLYTCSQPEVIESIAIGQVMICARMLLKVEVFNSQSPRYSFLTTTRDSQVYSLCKPGEIQIHPFSESNFVNTVIDFRKLDEAKAMLCASCHGGSYDFPPLPTNFIAYKNRFPRETPLQPVSMENIPTILNDLHYLQRVRLTLQGFVVAMEFVPIETEEAEDNLSELSCSLNNAMKESTEEYQSSQTESSSSQIRTRSQTKRERFLKGTANQVCTRGMAKIREANKEYDEGKQVRQKESRDCGKRTSQERTNATQDKREDDNESENHFPYKVLDTDWKENGGLFLTLGLPSAHEHALPTSSGDENDVFIQTVDGKRFVKSQGYWRFLIIGLNRRTVLSAVFFPETHTEVSMGENDLDQSTTPFMHMLSNGRTPAGFEVKTLLNCGEKELKMRRTVFVVDVFSYGAGVIQIVLKRAF